MGLGLYYIAEPASFSTSVFCDWYGAMIQGTRLAVHKTRSFSASPAEWAKFGIADNSNGHQGVGPPYKMEPHFVWKLEGHWYNVGICVSPSIPHHHPQTLNNVL